MATAQNVITRVRNLIMDTGSVRWADAEMLDWINDGQREIARIQPTAYPKRVDGVLLAGVHQSLAGLGVTDGHAVLDVLCNVSAADAVGRAITSTSRNLLDRQSPSWWQATGTEVRHWIPEPATPKEFYVFPALSPLGDKVRLIYAAVPPAVTLTTDTIPLDEVYIVALGYYVAFRAYSKDVEVSSQAAAAGYYTLFLQALGKGA